MDQGDILLTGASGVIGTAIAKRLARAGYRLHLTSRQPTRLKALATELHQSGVPVSLIKLDLAKHATIEKVVHAFFRSAKNPVGVICGAGHMGELGELSQARLSAWLKTVDENFTAQVLLIRAYLLAHKKKRLTRGRIVAFSGAGLGGDGPFSHMSAYGSAKAALTHFVEAISAEVQPLGITVNTIAPGQVLSTITQQVLKAGNKAGHLQASAQRCIETGGTSPDLAAQLVEFLLTPAADGITGRLISARFDLDSLRNDPSKVNTQPSLYRLRRIDNNLYEKR